MSENRRIINATLFLEDESEMSHQEGLDVFQIRKTKERITSVCARVALLSKSGDNLIY